VIGPVFFGVVTGFVLSEALRKLALHVAKGGSTQAIEARRKVYAGMDHDRLKQIQNEVAAELLRRQH
jgi:hypothetical protein